MIIKDQLDREISIQKIPERIISLVPSQTELLVDMGLSNRIVGVTKFCVHPDTIKKEKTIVGGTKQVNFETIKKLHPDLILCNKEENIKEIVEALQDDYAVHVSDVANVEDALCMIHQYGEIFEKEKEAKVIIEEIRSAKASFELFIKDKPKKKVAYFIWRKPWMAAGNGTFIHYLMELNGFINVFGHQDRYPEVTEAHLKSLEDIDLVLLSSEPFPFSNTHLPEVQQMIPNAKIILVDGEYFSWYGARLIAGFRYFETLH
ncbi:helical backbone metal receptor [Aquimarina addita]|uniref:Helical backbone metal receptor n=1 Tax=Aquimarina addita TaxID=870485 RepID=A0ABP6UQ94_9FLAO